MSKASVIYDKFDRHSHAQGLKGHATHYCPGCGHGLAHKFLAEAIDELGVQDRTVAISPVGCSVFLYYYFDVGNSQAAHGRASVVALGHKFANPDSVVISYQGDGDLASIGLAETIATAQLGAPITVIFINNAIYGMTGGQMAPTTLMGQTATTCPTGRNQYNGQPMKMAEIIAGLDGPIYVERVALFDAKQRVKAKKAIRKALRNQVEGRGYSFIEVLAECPTHLKMSPEETESWVKDFMEPVFPLGVKKDVTVEPWFHRNPPSFEGEKILQLAGASYEHPVRHCEGFPRHLAPSDISLKLAGSGGDGAQTARLRRAIDPGLERPRAAVLLDMADEQRELAVLVFDHVGPRHIAFRQVGASRPAQAGEHRRRQVLDRQAAVGVAVDEVLRLLLVFGLLARFDRQHRAQNAVRTVGGQALEAGFPGAHVEVLEVLVGVVGRNVDRLRDRSVDIGRDGGDHVLVGLRGYFERRDEVVGQVPDIAAHVLVEAPRVILNGVFLERAIDHAFLAVVGPREGRFYAVAGIVGKGQ